MFKVDKIKRSFDCDLCNKLLIGPVVIPCGKVVCKSHLDNLLKNGKNTFNCEICQEVHDNPKNGFDVNERLQRLLEFELNTLEASPFFDECKKEIVEAQENLAKIELLKKNSENYIYEYFENIKRQVDIRREDLKFKVDKYSDDIIKSVESSQINFIKLSKEVNEITTNIEKSKAALGEFVVQFDTLKFNDEKKFEEIKSSVEVVNQEFCQMIDEYNSSLIGNKKYTFQFDELAIEDIFGRLYDSEYFDMDSTILDGENKVAIQKLCELPTLKEWKLKYRASRDGFSAQNFHAKCDNVANSLTVIKSTNGNIFGGFTEKPWTSVSEYVVDPKAFIYSLLNKENKPFRALCLKNGCRAIYCNSTYGPTFGESCDIRIASSSNVNQTSYSNFGSSYQHPDYRQGIDKAQNILAGSFNFQTLEIEVFTKAN